MGRFLTQNLFLPLSSLRRARNAGMRSVFEHYQTGLSFRRKAHDWSDDQKRSWILENLHKTVRRAATETMFYKDLFHTIGFDPYSDFTFDEFAKLPVLQREDIHRAGENLISRSVPRAHRLKDATGGSTGMPTEFWLGEEERGWSESGIQFSLELIGVPAGARIAYLWGHHLDPKASDRFSDRFRDFAMNSRFFDCFRLSPDVFQEYHEAFERYAPDCIVAYSSALGHFAEYLAERKIRPSNYPGNCFVTGAEKLYTTHRQAIERVFGSEKPVYERYGGRDFGPTAIQVDPNKNLEFEIDWTWSLVEPESSDERASILVTKLHADAMPMIRYRVGDIGRFSTEDQSGYPTFCLREVVGRELDRIWLPDGRWVHGAELPHLLKDYEIIEFMFVQAEDYSVELQIVRQKELSEDKKNDISRIIKSNLGDLPVRISFVEYIERTQANKWRPVVSRVKR